MAKTSWDERENTKINQIYMQLRRSPKVTQYLSFDLAIIEFGFRRIRRILQNNEGVIHLGLCG